MIKLQNVERVFQVGDEQVHALRHINLDISKGEYLSIMGPSGSGKSTLLNMIGLLDQPNSGHYYLDGDDVSALSEEVQADLRRNKIGFIFQFFHLVPRLSAEENIALPMVLAGWPPQQRKLRTEQALADMGIADRAHHRPDQLSGGQRQRVAIARATVMQPSVLLADEPTGNLDRTSGKEVIDILSQLNKQGITLIMVTHDPEIGARARRQLNMVDGAIVADSSVQP